MTEQQGFGGLKVAAFESRMAAEMTRLITRYGGQPLVAPSMREIPLEDNHAVFRFGDQLLAGQFDMVILLTGVGTRTMVEALKTRQPLSTIKAALARVSLVARGPKPIAALKELSLTPEISVPEPNTWRDILQALDDRKPVAGLRVAVQEYGISNTDLLEALRQRGAHVTRVPVYRWALPEDTAPLRQVLDTILAGQVDVVLITNAVQVDHVMQILAQDQLVERFQQIMKRMVVASIGEIASERLRSFDLPVDLGPSHPKMGILVKEASEQAQMILAKKRSA
ncbi:MAG: uroporphyrinogen-III synthase [Candidatus Methylomirabilaceae bacterium]